jgi:hypothetical protein
VIVRSSQAFLAGGDLVLDVLVDGWRDDVLAVELVLPLTIAAARAGPMPFCVCSSSTDAVSRSITGCAAPARCSGGVAKEAPPGAAVEGDALCAQPDEIAPGGDQHRNLVL